MEKAHKAERLSPRLNTRHNQHPQPWAGVPTRLILLDSVTRRDAAALARRLARGLRLHLLASGAHLVEDPEELVDGRGDLRHPLVAAVLLPAARLHASQRGLVRRRLLGLQLLCQLGRRAQAHELGQHPAFDVGGLRELPGSPPP